MSIDQFDLRGYSYPTILDVKSSVDCWGCGDSVTGSVAKVKDIYLCGNCFSQSNAPRTSCDIYQHNLEIVIERQLEEERKKEEEEYEKQLRNFCCRKFGKLCIDYNKDNPIIIWGNEGYVYYVEIEDCGDYYSGYETEITRVADLKFNYCPYCGKETLK